MCVCVCVCVNSSLINKVLCYICSLTKATSCVCARMCVCVCVCAHIYIYTFQFYSYIFQVVTYPMWLEKDEPI